MNAIGEWSIASFIRFVLDAAWWLVVVALVALVALLVSSFFIEFEDDNLTMNLPVALELNSPVRGASASSPADARIEQVRGNLRFPVRNGPFFSGSLLLVVVLCGCLLWVVTQLRQIFRSLSGGLLFIPDNSRRIRWVGFTMMLAELARAALVYFWSYYASLHFSADGLRFVASADLNLTPIFSGLAILVIAEVFREGTRLSEEQSLTI